MKKPILITCSPDDFRFFWEHILYIDSCIEAGFEEERIHILLYTPPDRARNTKWNFLNTLFPKVQIFRYPDKGIMKHLGLYIPIIRPHLLKQHFEAIPSLKEETILYTDSDILWLKNLDIQKLFEDDVCYISDAKGYMNADYYARKYNDVKEPLKGKVTRDFLKEICDIVGIPKEKAIENNDNTGGVQYILKGIDHKFWEKVEKDCLSIRRHFLNINREFFASENKGYQSWASDLFAVLYNLWYFNKEVKVVPEMDFVWSSEADISLLDKKGIFHNAGIVGKKHGNIPAFFKGDYLHKSPFEDPYVEKLLNNEDNKKLANHYYVEQIIKIKNKYKL